jgi:phage protein D
MPKNGKGPCPQPKQAAKAAAKSAAAERRRGVSDQPAVRRLGCPDHNRPWHAELPQFKGGEDKSVT